jgi:hypothetical protein
MAERRKKKKVVKRYSSKEAAEREAARQRAAGREARVRYDRRTGQWIVEIFILLVALSIFGSLLRRT